MHAWLDVMRSDGKLLDSELNGQLKCYIGAHPRQPVANSLKFLSHEKAYFANQSIQSFISLATHNQRS